MEEFKSKKFVFGMMLAIMGFVLVIIGKFPVEQWAIFEGSIGLTYVLGNIGADIAQKIK